MAEETLREMLAGEGIETRMELIPVNTDEEARRLGFPGNPTIRVDGEDLFPDPEREDWRVGCRVYMTPMGIKGLPTIEILSQALASKEADVSK